MRVPVLAALAALAASSVSAQDTSWASSVRQDGWPDGRVTADGDMIIFRRPAPSGPEGHPQLQLRYEYRDGEVIGGEAYLSMLALDEYDCRAGRFRNLRLAAFREHNAQGDRLQPPDESGAWSTPKPGTVDAKSLAAACSR